MGANTDVVKVLMTKQELLIELKDSQGNTPAHLAAQSLADDILYMLIEKQHSLADVQNNAGKTCIEIF
jgi:ankyrin repeat protein